MTFRSRVVLLIFVICFFAVAGLIPASSFGGDGNMTYSDTSPQIPDRMCTDDKDNNNHDGNDTNDLGCVKPIEPDITPRVVDRVEGNIWDTDLSQMLGDPQLSPTEAIMFNGHVYRGSNTKTMIKNDIGASGGSIWNIREYSVNNSLSEGNGWAFDSVQDFLWDKSDFGYGAALISSEERVVYHPSPLKGKDESTSQSCGDAIENEGSSQPSRPRGQTWGGTDDATKETVCRADWGEVYEKHHIVARNGGEPSPVTCGGCNGMDVASPCSVESLRGTGASHRSNSSDE